MDRFPSELISYIMRFLSVSDRKEASLVCRAWYNAALHPSLQRNIMVRCVPPKAGELPPMGLVSRKLTHLEFDDWDNQQISEKNLLALLSQCPSLIELDLSRCNNLFLSGRLLENSKDVETLKKTLKNVRTLGLGCLRFMTDITFLRLVSVFENLERISLASTNMIFGSGLYDVNQTSPAMLHFSAFLKFAQGQAQKLKFIDLSYTSVHDEALGSLAKIDGLVLEEIALKGCVEMSDKGLKMLVSGQQSLKIIDISGCKELGNSKAFFSTLAVSLPKLHTLKMRKCLRMAQCDMHALADFKSLHTVDIGEVPNLHDKDLIKGLCCHSPRLTSLSLPFCPDIHDELIIEVCKNSFSLRHLDLSSCMKLTDASLHAITSNLTSLITLRLPYCREISDVGILGYVPDSGVVPNITFDFDHAGCPCTRERDSKIFRKPIGVIERHRICPSHAHTITADGESLKMLSNLKSLQELNLSSCYRITNFALRQAIRFQELRILSLNSMTRIEERGIISIARHNPSLEEVYLIACVKVTDQAVTTLVEECLRLKVLDVSQCPALTDQALEAISANAARLRHLDISFNEMSLGAVARLEACMPTVKVIFRPHVY